MAEGAKLTRITADGTIEIEFAQEEQDSAAEWRNERICELLV
jgi:hypothetical protein